MDYEVNYGLCKQSLYKYGTKKAIIREHLDFLI